MSIGWEPVLRRSAFKIAFLAVSQATFCSAINRGAQNGSVRLLKMLILLRCVLFPRLAALPQVPFSASFK
jgi:hypothetical protein